MDRNRDGNVCGDWWDYNDLLDEQDRNEDLTHCIPSENVSRETSKPTFLAHETHPSDSYSQAIWVETPYGFIIYHCQACYDANKWAHTEAAK